MTSERPAIADDHGAIDVVAATKAFTGRTVLKGVDLQITPGQAVCLLGVNGAGKSTLLRIIAGLLHPDKGSVHIHGYSPTTHPEKTRRQLGVVSHKSMVYPELTVFENINFFGQLYGVKNCKARAEQLLEEVGLLSYRYDRAEVLSRGLLQRLAIARAMVHDPKILLADEPFTGLDTQACNHLISVLSSFAGKGGTVLITTHDPAMGLRCCNRVVVLDNGRLIFDSPAEGLNKTAFTEDYLTCARAVT